MIPHAMDHMVNITKGTHGHVSEITLNEMILPKFSCTECVRTPLEVDIYDAPNAHQNFIIGLDLLSCLCIVPDFNCKTITWDAVSVTMHN